jgi:hypothetical protein
MTPFNLECTAYAYMIEAGIEDYIPEVYGWGKRSVSGWGLEDIEGDKHGEYYGILMEWLEGAEQISIKNVTMENAIGLANGLLKIHGAGVLHFDTFVRNMMVFPNSKRAAWVDFSCAQIGVTEKIQKQEMYSGGLVPVELVAPLSQPQLTVSFAIAK